MRNNVVTHYTRGHGPRPMGLGCPGPERPDPTQTGKPVKSVRKIRFQPTTAKNEPIALWACSAPTTPSSWSAEPVLKVPFKKWRAKIAKIVSRITSPQPTGRSAKPVRPGSTAPPAAAIFMPTRGRPRSGAMTRKPGSGPALDT